jgi:hypothetical protein
LLFFNLGPVTVRILYLTPNKKNKLTYNKCYENIKRKYFYIDLSLFIRSSSGGCVDHIDPFEPDASDLNGLAI